MRDCAMVTLFGWLACFALAAESAAAVTEAEAEEAAVEAVRRAGGTAQHVTKRAIGSRTWAFTLDGRWWVGIAPETGAIGLIADHGFEGSEHGHHVLEQPPDRAAIEAVALELLRKVFPDLDMAEFVLESAKPQGEHARVEARWRRLIAECGFPGPGYCFVDFCWPDRAVCEVGAEDQPIPDEWRRPATVAAERAEEIGKAALGDLQGGWLETTKDLCVWDEPNPPRPAWNVLLRSGPRDKPEECMSIRSVFVDPWTGEIIHTTTWKGAGAGPAEPQAKPSGTATMPTAQPPTDADSKRLASRPWLPWAGGGAAVVVIALGATVVCVRRRRA